MKKLTFAAVSRNYFNLPIWVAKHRGMFTEEGLDVAIELHEGVARGFDAGDAAGAAGPALR